MRSSQFYVRSTVSLKTDASFHDGTGFMLLKPLQCTYDNWRHLAGRNTDIGNLDRHLEVAPARAA